MAKKKIKKPTIASVYTVQDLIVDLIKNALLDSPVFVGSESDRFNTPTEGVISISISGGYVRLNKAEIKKR